MSRILLLLIILLRLLNRSKRRKVCVRVFYRWSINLVDALQGPLRDVFVCVWVGECGTCGSIRVNCGCPAVGLAPSEIIDGLIGRPLVAFRLYVRPKNNNTRRVHLDLDLGLGAQHSIVDVLVEILEIIDLIIIRIANNNTQCDNKQRRVITTNTRWLQHPIKNKL